MLFRSVAGATVIVSSHQAIASRAQVTDAIDGSPTRQIDLVRLTGDQAVLQVDGRWQLQVPTETTTRARAALRLPGPGLYPIRIRLEVRGDPVAEVVTFVQRLADPDADEPEPSSMRVAIVADLHTPVALDIDGRTVLDPAAVDAVNRLAAVLAASSVPITIGVEPSVVAAMVDGPDADDESRAAVTGLDDALQQHELLSATSLPLDPSAAEIGRAHV